MEEKRRDSDQSQRNNERQGGVPYQQLAADMAPYLAAQQLPREGNEAADNSVMQNENGTENAREAPSENDNRRRRNHCEELAAEMAQPSADLQVAGGDNDALDGAEGGVEPFKNDVKTRPGKSKRKQKENNSKKGARNPYFTLAADVTGSFKQLRTPGSNDDRDSLLQREATDSMPHQESLSEYNSDATCGPGSDGHRSFQSETYRLEMGTTCSYRQENSGSVVQQESISEYNPDVTCGSASESCVHLNFESEMHNEERSETEYDLKKEGTGSFVQQESLSDYNPDATCGSGHESCGAFRDGDSLNYRGEGTKSVAQQESLSGYDESASCGSGLLRSDNESFEYSSIQTEDSQSFHEGSCGMEDHLSKSTTYFDATYGECHSKTDGEPYSKRTKPNPEVTEELSLPPTSESMQESIPKVSAANSERGEAISVESEGIISRPTEVQPMSRNVDTKCDPCLSSEFENMNLADSASVESGRYDFSLSESAASSFQSNNWQEAWRDPQKSPKNDAGGVRSNSNDFSDFGDYRSQYSAPVGNSQGARPKTTFKVPHGKKSKRPKQNTKNAYTELAKDLAGDVLAMNKQLEESQATARETSYKEGSVKGKELLNNSTGQKATSRERLLADVPTEARREANDRSRERKSQELFDGSIVENESAAGSSMVSDSHSVREQRILFDGSSLQTEMSNDTSLLSNPSEGESLSSSQQTSMTTNKDLGRMDVSTSRKDVSARGNGATLRERYDSEAERRAQLEEQQRTIDNMAPELQALVIQMMQGNEEEQRGYATHNLYYNPPVPPRTLPPARGRSTNQVNYADGASKKRGGKKSRKGPKNKGHYVELAGIIAPQFAAMNAEMVNGHGKEPQAAAAAAETTAPGMRTGNEPSKLQPGSHHEANGLDPNLTGARPRDHMSFSGTRLQSRDQSRGYSSMPHSGAQGRDTTDGRGASSLVANGTTSSRRQGNVYGN